MASLLLRFLSPLLRKQNKETVADRESSEFVKANEFLGADPAANVPALKESPSAVDELDESYRFRKGAGARGVRIKLIPVGDGPPGIFAVDDVELEVDLVVTGRVFTCSWLTVTVCRIVI